MGESNAGTLLFSKRWVVALLGALQRSGIEKFRHFADCRIADVS
jgi:hypothetical protein